MDDQTITLIDLIVRFAPSVGILLYLTYRQQLLIEWLIRRACEDASDDDGDPFP